MIPKIIHQLWKTDDIPHSLMYWQASWQAMHPDFEYRLWTNASIEKFIEDTAPEYKELFYHYHSNICRADLARYLILREFGGLYVDLDFECLRPHHSILKKHSLLIGLEPDSHTHLSKAVEARLKVIACNAWMASTPGHPFWDHLLQRIEASVDEPDILERTGPFLLTRAISSYKGDPVALVRAELVYPVDKDDCWTGRIQDLELFERATRNAYAMHHWVGTWFRPQSHLSELPLPLAKAQVHRVECRAKDHATVIGVHPPGEAGMVSCLMVTRGDPHRVRCAIRAFRAQTYSPKELVIVTDRLPGQLRFVQDEFAGNDINWVFVPSDPALTLGELRNRSVDAARGEYVIQWDDDDLHDPSRIFHQLKVMLAAKAQACMLSRWTVWWPERQRLFISGRRIWEGSLLCVRSVMPRYPHLARGEDSNLVSNLLQCVDTVLLDAPRLYTYVVHGGNTWDEAHFERIANRATADFSGPRYAHMLRELGRRLPVTNHLPASAESSRVSPVRSTNARANEAQLPSVLILTPMRNTAVHLDRYFDLVRRLQYPSSLLSIGILEGDSDDGTFERLLQCRTSHHARFQSFTLMRYDTGFQIQGPRWSAEIQAQRRANLAVVRNRLLMRCLDRQQWVLWLDADLVDYSPDLIHQMLEPAHPIAVPLCVREDGSVFDLNTFMFHPDRTAAERPQFVRDGLYQPPRGQGRRYLDSVPDGWAPVDGVGGTALLVKGDLHRAGLVFPTYSHRGYIETEGLAAMARDMGVTCWGSGKIRVVHAST